MSEEEKKESQEESAAPSSASDTTEHASGYDAQDIEKNKAIACLSYICILFLVPLLAEKGSKFAQFHAKQGMTLFIFWVVVDFALALVPFLGWMLLPIVNFLFIIVSIIALVKTLSGAAWEIPIVSDLAKKFKI